jgi:hypothetical protein
LTKEHTNYGRRHDDLPKPAQVPWLPRFIVRYIALATTALLIVAVTTLQTTADATCNGQNEVRHELTVYLVGQREQSKSLALYRQFFPDVPEAKLRKVRDDSVQKLNAAIRSLRPVDCGWL